jgi:GNAT superfamily N-acetyltransferase
MMIEPIDSHNLNDVLPLIRKYQEFYEVADIDDEKNREFFSQFGPSSDKGCLFGFRIDGELVAFATVYFCYASSIISKVAVMNDLFTSEGYRKQGIATKLIEHCERYAKDNGAARLQWVTAVSNKTAQSVYKALGATQSSWELFTYST